MAVQFQGEIVATGQVTGRKGRQSKAHIQVWDSGSLELKQKFGAKHIGHSVACLAFSHQHKNLLVMIIVLLLLLEG